LVTNLGAGTRFSRSSFLLVDDSFWHFNEFLQEGGALGIGQYSQTGE
jgi:hypothetical protein